MKKYIVITSIQAPNHALETIARNSAQFNYEFLVVGDRKSPHSFELSGCRFLSIDDQMESSFSFAGVCPENSYARKNIGYLTAISEGADTLLETDDDNIPRESFFEPRERNRIAPVVAEGGWVNVYRYFWEGDSPLWPRGFPLDGIREEAPGPLREPDKIDAPIQQYLADGDPDVDAIFRLLFSKEIIFKQNTEIALGPGSWCPFNSQNTLWWSEAFPLLYLPALCSFRMTDIFRSLVAQRIAWENGWSLLFASPTVFQQRNEHNLMTDFEQEIDGYLNNRSISGELEKLDLKAGIKAMRDNMFKCYEVFVRHGVVDEVELELLNHWHDDIDTLMGDI